LDDDIDAVVNSLDRCPATPTNEPADAAGCSGPQRDDDGDGTVNRDDACPGDPGKIQPGQCGCGKAEGSCVQVFWLRIDAGGSPAGSPAPQAFAAGSSIQLVAPEAPEGYRFSGWGGDVTGSDSTLNILMDRDLSITANYEAIPAPTPRCGLGTPVVALATMLLLPLMRRRVMPARWK
jgi:uncharacterized repeat protein (TIGR02543 family)